MGSCATPPTTWNQSAATQDLRGWFGRLASFLTVLTLVVLGIAYTMSRNNVADPDIWWHLHNAQYLFEHHALPNADAYSFTVSGHPWMNHEWMAEVPYYLGWRAYGLAGIQGVELLVLSAIFLGLLYLCYREPATIRLPWRPAVLACFWRRFRSVPAPSYSDIYFWYCCSWFSNAIA